jgi:hypothetical protein
VQRIARAACAKRLRANPATGPNDPPLAKMPTVLAIRAPCDLEPFSDETPAARSP